MDELFARYNSTMNALHAAEADFSPVRAVEWMNHYYDVPMYFVGLYVAMVFVGQQWMRDRRAFWLKPFFIVWNALLSAFSIYGCIVVAPELIKALRTEGFRYTLCAPSFEWWNHGAVGLWMWFFIMSKIPELVDTVFLVFQKKPVIFLHWYHHTTVLLYCWYSYTTHHTVGIWFGAMNFFVHSVMYSYYFMMSLPGPTRMIAKPFAPLITILQIAQMVMGLVIVVAVHISKAEPQGCPGNPDVIMRAALVMYASYFILFAKFFLDSYVFKKKKTGVEQATAKPKRS